MDSQPSIQPQSNPQPYQKPPLNSHFPTKHPNSTIKPVSIDQQIFQSDQNSRINQLDDTNFSFSHLQQPREAHSNQLQGVFELLSRFSLAASHQSKRSNPIHDGPDPTKPNFLPSPQILQKSEEEPTISQNQSNSQPTSHPYDQNIFPLPQHSTQPSRQSMINKLKRLLDVEPGYYLLSTQTPSLLDPSAAEAICKYYQQLFSLKIHILNDFSAVLEFGKEYSSQNDEQDDQKETIQDEERHFWRDALTKITKKVFLEYPSQKQNQRSDNSHKLTKLVQKYSQKSKIVTMITSNQQIKKILFFKCSKNAVEFIKELFHNQCQNYLREKQNLEIPINFTINWSELQSQLSYKAIDNLNYCQSKEVDIQQYDKPNKEKKMNKEKSEQNHPNSSQKYYELYFQNLAKKLKTQSINALSFDWNSHLKDLLIHILEEFDMYQWVHQKDFKSCVFLLDYKLAKYNMDFDKKQPGAFLFKDPYPKNYIKSKDKSSCLYPEYSSSNNLFQTLYPGIANITKKLIKKLELPHFWFVHEYWLKKIIQSQKKQISGMQQYNTWYKKQLQTYDTIADQLLVHFIGKKIVGDTQGSFSVKYQGSSQSLPLDKFISKEMSFFDGTSKWQDIFTLAKIMVEREKGMISPQKQQKQNQYMQNIEEQKLMNISCLNCTTFFIQNFNIRDDSINKTPFMTIKPIKRFKDHEIQLKQKICSLLNTPSGGAILLGCTKQNLNVIAHGQFMNQKQKQSYEQQIYYLADSFYPKVKVKKQITVEFVPIVVNPYQSPLKRHEMEMEYFRPEELWKRTQKVVKRQYKQGYYVLRIKIKPESNKQVYYWKNHNQFFMSITNRNNQYKQIAMKNYPKILKKKMKQYQPLHPLLTIKDPFLHHQCSIPEPGQIVVQDQFSLSEPRRYQKSEDYFNCMSMIVCNEKYHSIVKRRLRERRQVIKLEQKFLSHNLRSTHSTALLYHKCNFDQLLRILNSPDFQFQGKRVIAISISPYLVLKVGSEKQPKNPKTFPLDEQDLKTAQQLLNKQFPTQELKYFTFINPKGQIQYYAQTECRTSTLFMYYIFNTARFFKEKQQGRLKVFMKNPKDLHLKSDQEKQRIWSEKHVDMHKSYGSVSLPHQQEISESDLEKQVEFLRDQQKQRQFSRSGLLQSPPKRHPKKLEDQHL